MEVVEYRNHEDDANNVALKNGLRVIEEVAIYMRHC